MNSPLPSITEYPIKSGLIVLLLVLATTFAVYFKALSYGFLNTWDDPAYVLNNAAAHGFSWEHIKSAFSRFYVGNYSPVHIVSYMLDYTLWGLNPSGYILHNVILHALNGFMLYLVLGRFSIPVYPSLVAVLFFIVHPVQVESVVWISQRKNVLAMLFFLLAIFWYTSYRGSSGAAGRNSYLLAVTFFVCALLTKSVAVVLPPILMLYDFSITRRKLAASIPDKIPFVLLALLVGSIAMLSQSHEYGGGGRTAFHGGSAWTTFLTMLPVLCSYLRMSIAPVGLSIVYAPQIKTTVDGEVLFALLIVSMLVFAGYRLIKRDNTAFFWYIFIPVALLPVAQIVPLVTLMNDRYLYFPMLGIASCFGLFAWRLHDRVTARWKGALYGAFFIVVTVYGVVSFQRTLVWQDSLSLWKDATEKQPGSAVAWLVLGEIYEKKGEPVLAVKVTERAKAECRGVECYHVLENLSNFYLQSGNSDKAEQSIDELLRAFPQFANGYILKGYVNYQQGEIGAAEKLFTEGIRLDPNQPAALNALGNIYLATGRPDLAIEKLKGAELLGVSSAELYYSLACAEAMRQKREDALNHLEQALRLGYNKPEQIMKAAEFSFLRADPVFRQLMQTYFPKR